MRRGRMLEEDQCGDCEAKPGEYHERGCDVERCPFCGGQLISCGCQYTGLPEAVRESDLSEEQDEAFDRRLEARGRERWTGTWPGKVECREYGWYSRWRDANDPRQGYVRCEADHPDAHEDLNRLVMECTWDPEAKRWVRP